MAVSFNQGTGVWNVNGRGAYSSEAAARAADTGGAAPVLTYDDNDFATSFTLPTQVGTQPGVAPVRATATRPRVSGYIGPKTASGGASYDPAAQVAANASGNIGGAAGAYNAGNDTTRAAFDATHKVNQGNGLGASDFVDAAKFIADPIGGSVRAGLGVAGVDPKLGYLGQMATGPAGAGVGAGGLTADAYARGKAAEAEIAAMGTEGNGTNAAGGSYVNIDPRARTAGAVEDTRQAENQFQDKQADNSAENDNLFRQSRDRFDDLDGGDYGLSDEARGFQKEGLAQQRMLLEKMLDFDTDQYATQFADQALARQIALGRQGTSAASQQTGMFAAMDQAPALYAEGRRQADQMEASRLEQAESAAKAFGELGTMTRGADEGRAQFEAKLPLEIASQVANLTQGKMALNQEESQMFAEVWMDFARLQSVYAGYDSTEQIAIWDKEMAERGQDKQFEAIKAQLKANGAVSDKDLINGLFQLGGGLLSLGGRKGAA